LPLFHRADFVIAVDVVLIEILEEWRPYALCGPAGRCPTPDRRIDLLTTNLGVGSSNLSGRASDFNSLWARRRSNFKIKTVFRTANFLVRPLRDGL
jgi:hypothetical protein